MTFPRTIILVLVILEWVDDTIEDDLVNLVGEHGHGSRAKQCAVRDTPESEHAVFAKSVYNLHHVANHKRRSDEVARLVLCSMAVGGEEAGFFPSEAEGHVGRITGNGL